MHTRIVRTVEELRDVWRLTAACYAREGYVADDVTELAHHRDMDLLDEQTLYGATTVWYVLGRRNEVCGSVSVTVDTPRGLPDDPLFTEPLGAIRLECRYCGMSVANVWRLAISPDAPRCTVGTLLDQVHYWATVEQNIDVVVISVNPSHEAFYRRMYGFQPVTSQPQQSLLSNAPAVLMRWDRKDAAEVWPRVRRRFCCQPRSVA